MRKMHDGEDLFHDNILGEKLLALPRETAPPQELQEAVFSTLDALDFFSEVADLFTGKFALANLSILEAVGAPLTAAEPEEEE
ncbi:MAG: hypothetical protein KDD02_12465 [Phaeodactylibacter sp.]|nr:hypothetical protein [Phaeodactylibacter sp.]MCB9300477.1 hypothetical protein [Lewinellaceae bacterium]